MNPAKYQKNDQIKVIGDQRPKGWEQGTVLESRYDKSLFINDQYPWVYRVLLDNINITAWIGEEFLELD